MNKALGVFLLVIMLAATAPSTFAASFNLFSRVQTIQTTTLYSGPGESSGSAVGTQSGGALGTTVAGPLTGTDAKGVSSKWWLINFDSGSDGWASENSLGAPGSPLIAAPAPTPTPIPEPTPVPTPKPGSNIIYQNNFDSSPLGQYTRTQAEKEFPNLDKFIRSNDANFGIIQGTDEKGVKAFSGRSMKAELFDKGTSYSSLGIQFRLPGDGYDDLYSSYMYTTSPNFKSDTGGKMAALAGSSYATGYSSGNCLTDGEFNTKVHLSGSGVGGTQNYTFFYGMKDRCSGGTGFNWDGGDGSGSRVGGPNVNEAHGVWHHVEYRVKMNTPGKADGILQAWYDGKLMLDNRNVEWRKTDAHNIERAKLQAFVSGGNEIEENGHFLYYDNYVISTTRQGPPGTISEPPPPPTNPTTFSIGATVQTTDNLNVRTNPTGTRAGDIKGVQPLGSTGTIVDGPLYSMNSQGQVLTWWKIDFESGTDGWSVEQYLQLNGIVGLPKDVTPPTQPTKLSAISTASTRIDLTWVASYDDRGVDGVGYNIFRDGKYLTTTKNTSHSDTQGLFSGTTYTYTVQAFDAAGNYSIQSDKASATTPYIFIPPALPTTFSIGATVQTTDNLNVRTNPTGTRAGDIKGVQPLGSTGTIVDGPLYSTNSQGKVLTWWKIDFESGVDGWSVERYLQVTGGGGSTGGGNAQLLYQNNFENGWGDVSFERTCSENPNRFTIVNSPAGDGSMVAKVYNDGMIPCKEASGELKHRAELKLGSQNSNGYPAANATGEDYWFGWRVFVPNDYPTRAQESGQVITMQLIGGSYGPEFTINLVGGDKWNITRDWSTGSGDTGNEESFKSVPAEKGVWTNFVVHRKRSFDGKGITQVWKNGEKVVDTTLPWSINYPAARSGNLGNITFKTGAYWGTAQRDVKYTLYFDNARVAKGVDGYSLVDPSKGVISGGPTPVPTTVPLPTPTTFSIGAQVFTTDNLNVRTAASATQPGTIKGTQSRLATGTIVDGPLYSTNSQGQVLTWWKIDFESGADGWSVETYLEINRLSEPTPVPTPTIFKLNATVQTTDNLNVRTNPTGTRAGDIKGVQPLGSTGTIVDGPLYSMNSQGQVLTWWKIDFESGTDGWSVERYLQVTGGGEETGGGSAQLIYENTFESGVGDLAYLATPMTPTGCESKKWSRVSDPTGARGTVFKILQQGGKECLVAADLKHRALVEPRYSNGDRLRIEPNKEYWVGYRIYFPTDFETKWLKDNNASIIHYQTNRGAPHGETPSSEILSKDGRTVQMIWNRQYITQTSNPEKKETESVVVDAVKGAWNDIVLHFILKEDKTGYLQVWYDGEKKVDLVGQTDTLTSVKDRRNDDTTNLGLYWGSTNRPHDWTVYLDNWRIATGPDGFATVDPSK